MDYDHIERMYQEAHSRISDADLLSGSLKKKSDSDAILRVLGFEILLKCAILLCKQKPKGSHDYSKLWLALSGKVQKEVLESAKNRVAGHADFSDLSQILKSLQIVFEKARYYYEFYEGYTLEEQTELGKFWLEIGAPTNEADVQYFPMELKGLIHGLSEFIKKEISNKRVN